MATQKRKETLSKQLSDFVSRKSNPTTLRSAKITKKRPQGNTILLVLPTDLIGPLDRRVEQRGAEYAESRAEVLSGEQLAEANRILTSEGSRAANAYLRECRAASRTKDRVPSRTSVIIQLLREAFAVPAN